MKTIKRKSKKKKVVTRRKLLGIIVHLESTIRYLEERITRHKLIYKKVEVIVPVFTLAKKKKKK